MHRTGRRLEGFQIPRRGSAPPGLCGSISRVRSHGRCDAHHRFLRSLRSPPSGLRWRWIPVRAAHQDLRMPATSACENYGRRERCRHVLQPPSIESCHGRRALTWEGRRSQPVRRSACSCDSAPDPESNRLPGLRQECSALRRHCSNRGRASYRHSRDGACR